MNLTKSEIMLYSAVFKVVGEVRFWEGEADNITNVKIILYIDQYADEIISITPKINVRI